MTFTIKCPKCRIEYSLEGKYLADKKEVTCPNCETRLSDIALDRLKNINECVIQNSKGLDDFLAVKFQGTIRGSSMTVLKP